MVTHFFSISGIAGVGRCFLSQFWPRSHGLSWIMAEIASSRCQRALEAPGEFVCRDPALSHSECQPWHGRALREGHQNICHCPCVLLAGQGAGHSPRAGLLAVPMLPSAGRGTGTEPLQAEQVMVLSREQIRRCFPCPPRPPQPGCPPGSAASGPTSESKTKLPGSKKPAGLEKRISWSPTHSDTWLPRGCPIKGPVPPLVSPCCLGLGGSEGGLCNRHPHRDKAAERENR